MTDQTKKYYRLKHKVTGLYYKPGVPNLSQHGKVYSTANNGLHNVKETVVLFNKGSRMAKLVAKKGIVLHASNFRQNVAGFVVKPEDFEKEYYG